MHENEEQELSGEHGSRGNARENRFGGQGTMEKQRRQNRCFLEKVQLLKEMEGASLVAQW